MLASAGVGARGSSAKRSRPPAGPVRAGCGKEEGRKVRELGQQSRPSALEKKEKGGGVRLGHRAGQARREREKRAGPDPGVGLKMEEGEFSK